LGHKANGWAVYFFIDRNNWCKIKNQFLKIKIMSASSTPPSSGLIGRLHLDWNDFHLILQIARLGSVARACRALNITHATVLRQLKSIESRLQTRVFDRQRGRYTPTPAGDELLAAAQQFEALAQSAELRIFGQDLRPRGHVRVAVAGVVLDYLLPSVLAPFMAEYPEITLEFAASREPVSLLRREADMAIRIADRVPEWLVGRRFGEIDFAIYGAVDRFSPVDTLDGLLSGRHWIGFEQGVRDFKSDRWLSANVPDELIALRVDNFSHAAHLASLGFGIAVLPTFVEGMSGGLLRLLPVIPELRTPVWLLTHLELRGLAKIGVVMKHFGDLLRERVADLQLGV
jgi:DNA-binding transcriptional LysR family regulator